MQNDTPLAHHLPQGEGSMALMEKMIQELTEDQTSSR